MLFSFKISFPWFYFFFKPLIRMNLTVPWNNGDYSKAIKFLKMLFIPVTFTSHPLNTDDRCQEAKASTNGKTIKNEYHLVLSDTFKHFSVHSPFTSHFYKMLMQCSKDTKHLLSHSPCRRHLIFFKSSEIQMIFF